MDNNTRNTIYIAGAAILIAVWYNNRSEKKEAEINANSMPDEVKTLIETTQDINIPEPEDILIDTMPVDEKIKTLSFGQFEANVSMLKRVLRYYAKINLDTTDIYDKDTLVTVQKFFKNSPALFDFENGEICENLIVNLDYILKKKHYSDQVKNVLAPMDGDCEWISKGAKGKDVIKMEEVLYYIAEEPDKRPTALYTKNLASFVDTVLAGANIYDNSNGEAKVCKRWIDAMHVFINNLKAFKNGNA